MVQKLLELELKNMQDGQKMSDLLVELGDVFAIRATRQGDADVRARARRFAGEEHRSERCLEDVQVDEIDLARSRRGALLRAAHDATTVAAQGPALRARGAHRAPLRSRGSRGDARRKRTPPIPPTRGRGALREAARRGATHQRDPRAQRKALSAIDDAAEQARSCVPLRHALGDAPPEPRARRRASAGGVRADPDERSGIHVPARDLGNQRRQLGSRRRAARQGSAVQRGQRRRDVHLAQAATLTWRQLGNLMRARGCFERLSAVSRRSTRACARSRSKLAEPVTAARRRSSTSRRPPAPSLPVAANGCRPKAAAARPLLPSRSPAARRPPVPRSRGALRAPCRCSRQLKSRAGRRQRTSPSSRALAEKQESAKRYNEYVKTLIAARARSCRTRPRGSISTNGGRSLHQQVRQPGRGGEGLRGDPRDRPRERAGDRFPAADVREAARLGEAPRAAAREAERCRRAPRARAKFLEIAKLATERVKKPEVCIELWQRGHRQRSRERRSAQRARRLYERAKDFDSARQRAREAGRGHVRQRARSRSLGKLGTIYGDRLNNDEGAVDAWRTLLALDPTTARRKRR